MSSGRSSTTTPSACTGSRTATPEDAPTTLSERADQSIMRSSARGDFGEQSYIRALAPMKACHLKFFVRTVHLIVIEAKADEQRIEPKRVLEHLDDGDGGAAAHEN